MKKSYSQFTFSIEIFLLPSAAKLRQGNVFTPVCHSVQGVPAWGASQHALKPTPPGRHSPGQTPPARRNPTLPSTPMDGHPIWQAHPLPGAGTLPSLGRPPAGRADGYCSGRYASYWNAFLFWFLNLVDSSN